MGEGEGHGLVGAELALPAHFARLAAAHGARTALVSEAWQPDYAELNAAANRLARAIRARGGAPGDRIALLMAHDAPLIAALLAALKAGCIATVLNPSDPETRLRALVEDAGPSLVLADASNAQLADRLAGSAVLHFDMHAAMGPSRDPEIPVAGRDIAALIYTSGSTGRPKGVMQTHRQVLHNAMQLARAVGMDANDRVVLLGALSGGQGMAVAWSALSSGATLCPFPVADVGVAGLAEWLVRQRITTFISSASLFRHFVRTLGDTVSFPLVRAVRLASEPATAEDFRAFLRCFPNARALVHTLASSETGNVAVHALPRGAAVAEGRLPVGRAVDGMEVMLLDEQGEPVAPGAVGEIVVRSRFLAAGYWRNDALTAARFVAPPGGGDVRLFRSGDLGRIGADGLLELAGRKDARIKIRGHRVELSEVEGALLEITGVEAAAVGVRERAGNEPELCAYVALRDRALTPAALRRALREALPGHMVPASIAIVAAMPLTPHGKIDREQLARTHPVREADDGAAPASATEALLRRIWQEALGVADIGSADDFFQLGGDSLIASVVAARVHAALGVELRLVSFIAQPALADLARHIDEKRLAAANGLPELVRTARRGAFPLSFAQERVWRYSQTPQQSAGYLLVSLYRIAGALDVVLLRRCMNAIAARHEILRTTIAVVDGRPTQVVHPPSPVPLDVIDLSGAADPEQEAMRLLDRAAVRPIVLGEAPLMRFVLVRLRASEHWFQRTHHHIISDGWSWRVYFAELAALYAAGLRGTASPLPASEPLQYGDYAAWQRAHLRPDQPGYRAEVAWWRERFARLPKPLALPFARAEPAGAADPQDGFVTVELDDAAAQRLDRLVRREGTTYFALRAAAIVAALSAATGEPDIVIGTYVTNRTRLATQRMFGHFANLVALRLLCDPKAAFRDLLRDVRAAAADTEARSEIPHEMLYGALRAAGVDVPEIRAILNLRTRPGVLQLGDVTATPVERRSVTATMPWGFSIALGEEDGTDRWNAYFDARLYDPARVRAFIAHCARLLDAAAAHPDRAVEELVAASR